MSEDLAFAGTVWVDLDFHPATFCAAASAAELFSTSSSCPVAIVS